MTHIDSNRQSNLEGKKKKKQKQKQRRAEKREQERGKCREGEKKLSGGLSVRAAVGSQMSLIPWTVSPVMIKEEDFSPQPKCFTETNSNSLWTATAYDGVSTDQSTLK